METNGVASEWDCNPFWSDVSIVTARVVRQGWYPLLLSRSCLGRGIPPNRGLGWRRGYPQTVSRMGVSPRQEQGLPPPSTRQDQGHVEDTPLDKTRDRTGGYSPTSPCQTGYAKDSLPLAVAQEGVLVFRDQYHYRHCSVNAHVQCYCSLHCFLGFSIKIIHTPITKLIAVS